MLELEYSGIKKTLAEWGLAGVNLTKISCAPDELTFTATSAAFDSPSQFAYDSPVVLWRDGVRHFSGRIVTPMRSASAEEESVSYRALGPWALLDRIIFEQPWKKDDGEQSATVVVLGKDINGHSVNCGNQISAILAYAQAQVAGFEYSRADLAALDIIPPAARETDIPCSSAVLSMLRWHKDVTTYFDYSGAIPMLRFCKHSAAVAVDIDVNRGAPNEEVSIVKREDLQARGTVVRYSKTNTVDGVRRHTITKDVAGAETGLDVIKMHIELEGSITTTEQNSRSGFNIQYQRLETLPAPYGETEVPAWLMRVNPWLTADDVESIVWSNPRTSPPDEQYIRILVAGSVQEWMHGGAASGSISADALITYVDGTKEKISINDVETFTDLHSRLYSHATNNGGTEDDPENTDPDDPGEPVPTGQAAKIFAQFALIQFEGSFSLLEDEVSGTWHPGLALNLTGGHQDWINMRAQIQQVIEDFDAGRTILKFGPASHLSPQDFIELTRTNRLIKPDTATVTRSSGGGNTYSGDKGFYGGDFFASKQVSYSRRKHERFIVEAPDPSNPSITRKVDVDAGSAAWTPGAVLCVNQDGTVATIGPLRLMPATVA